MIPIREQEPPLIELENFRYTYFADTPLAVEAVRGVSLSVRRGEHLAIVGPSQSGKSTIAHALAHLLKLSRGQVLVAGQDIAAPGFDRAALRRMVGIVFQDPESQLVEDVVGKDVAFGPTAAGLSAAETRERVEESLNAVGLPYREFRLRYVYALSGGQKRRVALAGVLAMQTPVLVLDEPMAGLDPVGRNELLALIRRLAKERDLTLIICSTGLTDAALLCEKVVVLDAGKKVLQGPVTDVLARLDELAELQITLPEAAVLARRLGEVLPDMPTSVLTAEDLERELVRRLGAA